MWWRSHSIFKWELMLHGGEKSLLADMAPPSPSIWHSPPRLWTEQCQSETNVKQSWLFWVSWERMNRNNIWFSIEGALGRKRNKNQNSERVLISCLMWEGVGSECGCADSCALGGVKFLLPISGTKLRGRLEVNVRRGGSKNFHRSSSREKSSRTEENRREQNGTERNSTAPAQSAEHRALRERRLQRHTL